MCLSPVKLKDINTSLKGVILCFASVILTVRQNINKSIIINSKKYKIYYVEKKID